MAPFGDSAVAGWAIVGRVIPVAFGAIFALSAIIGPIIGQNYGAAAFDRVRAALTQSLLVTAAFTGIAWAILAALAWPIAGAFDAIGETADLIVFFCRRLPPMFLFLGALFVANAAFNTLGRPHYSTALNWGRATFGTIPFVQAGAILGGAAGVLAGSLLGGVIFGILAVCLAYRWIDQLAAENARIDATPSGSKAESAAAE
jgi:Na+-driven multidrug efflux pump